MTDSDFARALGVPRQIVSNWKTRGLPAREAPRVAEALKLSLDYVLRGSHPSAPAEADDDSLRIPVMSARASAGAGEVNSEESVVGQLAVTRTWARTHLAAYTNERNLACLTAYGDSMEPTFRNGDILIVDRGVNEIRLDAVYVLSRDGELFVKRVQRMLDGSLAIRSDNPNYQPQTIRDQRKDRISVLGRVLWAWNGRAL